MRRKIRDAELLAGLPRRITRHGSQRVSASPEEKREERERLERGEAAYRRLISDWSSSRPKKKQVGAGADTGARILKPG